MNRPAAQHKRATYPGYKPSGVEWVGDVPEHWEVRRLKHVASVQFSSVNKHTTEGEEPVRLCNYVNVYYNDFIADGLDFMATTATGSEIARFQLRRGDVLVTKDSESWDDIAVPAYVAGELDGVLCGYHLEHIRPHPHNLLGEYLFRAFRSRGINDQFRVAANGITRFGLGKYWLDNGLFPVPPLEEQRAIAAFLDRETARIDALIEKKRRTLVHFAVDTDEVYMATRLSGCSTYFLPFNRGCGGGAGNPENPGGYKTAYLWEEVLERHSFLDILARFIHLQVEERQLGGRKVKRETVIFPRYQQLDCVRKLAADARGRGTGTNYLVQHSAGSGKSNSITWLAHRLASLYTERDEKVFESIIVVTDRVVLDQQLQNTIYQFEHKQGVVQKIDINSTQLAEALGSGVPVVITTLQKFPFVTEKMGDLPMRQYAVIVDEAHSSQGGETATELKGVLAGAAIKEEARAKAEEEGLPDYEEEILKTMAKRGHQPNISFFAFTATPKYKTLEVFGTPGADGKPQPFHLYSMRQAIDEGFILDVLQNYTTYKTYYRLIKSIEDDPKVDKRKAARALARFMSLHPHNIAQKTEVMVEHFRHFTMHKIGGRAKAMVVTSSRLHAVRYMKAFERYIADNGYQDVRPLVAFSGTVRDPENGGEYTEPGMNIDVVSGKPISEAQLPERFNSPDYQILLVANKYQTGFDQPLLHTMYVDKRLDGVQAVQTLSRLNRMIPGKDAPFVLDFINNAEDIFRAFKPYYDKTGLAEVSDPSKLETLKHELNQMQIYHWSEVEAFAQVFYKPMERQNAADHAHMQRHLQPAVDRFKAVKEGEKRQEFRDKLSGYIRLYAFLSQIIPYADPELEMLYSYGRFLLPHLPIDRDPLSIKLTDNVALQYYRMERIYSGAIEVKESEARYVKSPTDTGTGKAKDDKAPLSEIIQVLNERFGTQFTEEDRLFFQQIKEKACKNDQVIQTAMANPLDKFVLGIRKLIENLMIDRMAENDKIVTRYMADQEFQGAAFPILAREIFEAIRSKDERDLRG